MKRFYICLVVALLVAGCMEVVHVFAQKKPMPNPLGSVAPHKVLAPLFGRLIAEKAAAARAAGRNPKDNSTISGTLLYTDGTPAKSVVVSDGVSCVVTDSVGHYKLKRDKTSRFVFYTVPADCEVPVHSSTDHTACFYLALSASRSVYDFTLTHLPEGRKETDYRMIVIGDPQVTNAVNPYYEGPDDNPVSKSDVARFTDETMVDIRRTISRMPAGVRVYGISMGDDVQYYGGYNATLERQIRTALGTSEMRLFSVIGNHDQDGSALYKRKWEDSWGPTDYSFDRGDEHYVCFNNVQFTKNSSYYSPGELTDKQMAWLRQDLALTPKYKKVVLCYHIPLTFGNRPSSKAQSLDMATEEGHYSSSRLSSLLRMLYQFKGGYELFCGHTHFAINHEIEYEGHHVMEHCHAAACGNIWQSDINICGTPNGYYVYSFAGGQLTDCYYKGTFWPAERQMTLFRASTDFNGESYANDWNLPHDSLMIVANVFNADSRWTVTMVENGQEYPMHRITNCGQDAFSTGYHHKYSKAVPYRFTSKQNGYLIMNHLYYYEQKMAGAAFVVRARDPYGHVFECGSDEIVTEPFFNYAHSYATK